jgi:hypothetical protein
MIMSFLDRLFGRNKTQVPQQPTWGDQGERFDAASAPPTDEQAIQRYRYMLRTAPPETIEQAHAEAFAQLTPEQRAQVLGELSATLPANERGAGGQDDPKTLARLATRAELRQPGTLERTFGGMRGTGGMGMIGGGMFGGSFLNSLAGAFVGSMIAQQFFGGIGSAYAGEYGANDPGQDAAADPTYDDAGYDSGGDISSGDGGGGDFGGDF